jgi:hypothetical protein
MVIVAQIPFYTVVVYNVKQNNFDIHKFFHFAFFTIEGGLKANSFIKPIINFTRIAQQNITLVAVSAIVEFLVFCAQSRLPCLKSTFGC